METGEPCPSGNVRGGMGEVSRLLAETAVEAGARIHLGSAVDGCLVEGGRVRGIRLHAGTEVRSRVVLSNRDPKATILEMLPADAVPPHAPGLLDNAPCEGVPLPCLWPS